MPATASPGLYNATVALRYASGEQTGTVTQDLPILLGIVPQAGMTATADSSQEPSYDARYAIDDDPTTMWHSQWDPYQPLPHEITLDLGGNYNVSGLLYQPRQDNNNGVITSYTVSVSTDDTSFSQVPAGSWADDFNTKSAQFPVQPARYIRLTALVGHNGYASAAEINVMATPTS